MENNKIENQSQIESDGDGSCSGSESVMPIN